MFKKILLIAGIMCFTTSMPSHSYAHGDGGHTAQVAAEDVVNLASQYVASLIKHDKKIEGQLLDASWLEVPDANKKIARQESWYYVVSLQHHNQDKTLYLMISKKGKLYRVNYQGVFKGFEASGG